MDERGRKRASKWDLIDGKISLEDNGRENNRDVDYRTSSNDYKYYSGRHSSGHAVDDNSKDRSKYEPDLTDRDRASEYRGSKRNNSFDRDNKGFSEAGTNWDEDESRRDRTRSPKSSWQMPVRSRSRGKSRSRSRSPVTVYRHESDMNDRRRSRPEVPIQTCRDFTSGRCRRGSHCPFLHPSSQNYEDRRYEYEHKEDSFRGGNYSHYNASDGQYNDFTRDTNESRREYDRNNRGAKRESRRSDDIPCTFFAAGNCRNGKFCRFSHQIQTACSSGERARDERWIKNHSPEKVGQVDPGTKFSDTVDPRDERWRKNHSPEKIGQVDSGTELNNSVDPRNERWRKNQSPEKIRQVDSGTEFNNSANPRNERWRKNHSPEKIGQVDRVAKFSATDFEKEGRWGTIRSPGRVHQIDRGVTFSETADPHVIAQGRECQTKKNSSSLSSGWASNMEVDYVKHGLLTNMDKLVNVEANQPPQWKSDNRDNINSSSELKGAVNWVGDKISPERKPKVEPARNLDKDEPAYAIQKSDSVSHIVPSQKESQRTHNVQSEMQNNAEKAISQQIFNPINEAPGAFSYDKNLGSHVASFSSGNSAKPSTQDVLAGVSGNLNAAGQGQYMCAPNFPGNEDVSVIRIPTTNYDMRSVKPNCEDPKTSGVTSGATPSTLASQANLTDLSASLAHLLGKGQQLPQLYTAINPLNAVSSVDTSNRIVSQFSLESVKPYPPSDSKEPNQPVCDNTREIELAQNHSNQGLLRTSEDVKQETLSAGQNAGEAYNNGCVEKDLGNKADAYSEPKTNSQTIRVESTKGKDKPAELREGSPLQNMGGEGKVGGGKKGKESKALRDFKYALVNFVKELLKTAWKDGQIDKEGYKTIVKKVVDKVTGTIQETSIPQTPEKVDNYLSASKPKLMKLVQAYVDRNPKKQV